MIGDRLYARAREVIPGGVCASVRLNQALGKPVYVAEASGSRFTDVDGREYIDMCCSHGAALLGHGHPDVQAALAQAAEMGICCSFDTPHHTELAEMLCDMVPCAERVRFTNSGTEATLHALRLCRAYSGRDKILRFTGHFHGYHELIYIDGHPPAEQLDDPSAYIESAGIPEQMSRFVIALPFNDLGAVAEALAQHDDIGTIILEPVNYNSGCILPREGYLNGLRDLATEHGVVLFFDEIQSALKNSPGGAQEDFGVVPDICTMGKAVGGGVPLSVICGRAEIMDRFRPEGDVQHSGTFNAHLASILAGLALCRLVRQPGFYPSLRRKVTRFHEELDGILGHLGVPVAAPHHGARFGLLMGPDEPPANYRETLGHRRDIMLAFVRETFARGVYFADYGGGPCHRGFSAVHSDEDLSRVLEVMQDALSAVGEMFGRRS